MVDGKPEAFNPDIGDGIYVIFQQDMNIFALNNIARRMFVQDDVRVGGKLKMAAWNRK